MVAKRRHSDEFFSTTTGRKNPALTSSEVNGASSSSFTSSPSAAATSMTRSASSRRLRSRISSFQLALLGLLVSFVACSSKSSFVIHADALVAGDGVHVTMNKVWPYNNPMETYSYYQALPVCHPGHIEMEPMSWGQIMRGDRLVNSLYRIQYEENLPSQTICSKELSAEDIETFKRAIDQNYVFEIYVADLPINKPVGLRRVNDDGSVRYLLVTSFDFNLGFNEGQVVVASMTADNDLTDITETVTADAPTRKIEFRYSVTWEPSEVTTHERLHAQLKGALTPATATFDIHWLAIINSFVLVVFIVSLLLLITLRVVRSDLSKYLRIPDEELASGAEDETGWKLLRADVFRPPQHRMWFCACVGSGAHLFLVVVTIVVVGCFSPYVERGTILSSGLFGYLLTSFIAGFCSANLYKRLGGEKWAWNILITAIMFMGPFFLVWSLLNAVALSYGSTAALPFSTASLFFACWFFVTLPLTVLGGIIGRQRAVKNSESGGMAFPCKTNKLAREIPSVVWYQHPWVQAVASGFLPFSAIYIELHYVFVSVWGTKIYTLYGVLLMAFFMLLLVSATVCVLLTYFHLNAEDHRWWWRSFVSGGSVAFFFYIHSSYYFFTSTRMYGALQIAYFFGYSLLVAFGLFLTMGFVTFTATYLFVYGIYSSIKSD